MFQASRERWLDGEDAVAAMRGSSLKPKLLYVVSEDWYFCSHRLPIARAARDAGFAVAVATRIRDHGEQIEGEGLRLVPLTLRRRSSSPLRELASILALIRMYRRERPDLVHHVAVKPILYGSLAARIAGVPAVVNAFAGMGYAFTSGRWTARLLRPMLRFGFRMLLNNRRSRLIVQNLDDMRMLVEACNIDVGRVTLIRGSGVDIARFRPTPEPEGVPIAGFVSRMLWDKGAAVLVEASRRLRQRGVPLRVVLVGDPDPDNPASIPEERLRQWQTEGAVEWWGHCGDIPSFWAHSHIAVFPTTYGEGVPKTLLEAAACGRPLVATDVPGCREIVRHEENGLLVPENDPAALASAIERLAASPELRRDLGQRGREIVVAEFSEAVVVERTLGLYRSMLSEPARIPASRNE